MNCRFRSLSTAATLWSCLCVAIDVSDCNLTTEWQLLCFYTACFSHYCHLQLNNALAIANLFIWKQCQNNKQGLEFHIWVALWMTCSMWAPWGSRTAWRRNTKYCTTRVRIPLVTSAHLSLILSFSSGRVRGALLEHFVLQITPEDVITRI